MEIIPTFCGDWWSVGRKTRESWFRNWKSTILCPKPPHRLNCEAVGWWLRLGNSMWTMGLWVVWQLARGRFPFPSRIQLSGLFEWKLIVGCCRRTKWWTTSTSSSRILQVWPRAKQPHLQLFMFTWINIGSLDGMGIRVKTANDDKLCFYEDEDEDWDGAEVGFMGPTSLFGSTTG